MRQTLWMGLLLAGCVDATEPVLDAPAARNEPTGRPNVLLILTDDQDAKSLWVSPTIRSLIANQGLTFTRAFVTTSICGPSRVSILRGQYAHNTGVILNNQAWPRSVQGLDQSTVATWLDGAGYTTAWMGKYLNLYGLAESDAAYTPPGWDEWGPIIVVGQGTEYGTGYYPTRYIENGAWVTHDGSYSTDFLTDRAVDFIHKHAAEPWFLVVSYFGPHQPETAAPRHAGTFAALAGLRPPSFNVPKVGIPTLRQLPLPQNDINGVDKHYRQRLETLLAVDEGVGDLFAALDSTGVTGNTLVIYTSDNGYLLGEHAEQQKNLPYEESNRVPMLIRGPGVQVGKTTRKMVANIDLAPTIADYAGVSPPGFVDGRSLRPLLSGAIVDDSEWRKRLMVEHRREGGITQAGVRTTSVYWSEWSSGQRELYDMRTDTFQTTNRALGPNAHADLRAWLAALRTCAGASCRTAEGP